MKRVCLFLFLASMMFASCKKETSANIVSDSAQFYDASGRVLILHGASLYTNDVPGGYHRYSANSAKRLINDWGLNSVRMFWSWHDIEPDNAVFDPAKLDSLVKIVETFTNEKVYVVLAVNGTATSSQDQLANTWQTPHGNIPNNPALPGNANPAAQEATRRFWDYKNYPYLQDEFIRASLYLANCFKNNPYVLGYDIINEPWGDGLLTTFFNSNLETKLLPDFYARYIRAMRNVEPDKYIFFEPTVLFNVRDLTYFKTKLPVINDARAGIKHLSFAPHCYLGEPPVNSIRNNYDAYLNDLGSKYDAIRQKQHSPIYIGEWSNIDYTNFGDWENYLNKHFAAFDSLQMSWSYFSYIPGHNNLVEGDDVTENPPVNLITRVYPRAIAGKLIAYRYDPGTKKFTMSFVNDASISSPTEIFIPQRHYPGGWNISVNGTANYTTDFNATENVLKFSSNSNTEITIEITSK